MSASERSGKPIQRAVAGYAKCNFAYWIAYFKSLGCSLFNMHGGGGASVKHSAETLAKIAAKRNAWLADPANIERLRKKSLAAWADKDARTRMVEAQNRALTPALKALRSKQKKIDWAENQQFRERFAAAQKKVSRSEIAKEFWSRPDYRARQSQAKEKNRDLIGKLSKAAWDRRKGL